MSTYQLVLAAHVIIAILGLGQLAILAGGTPIGSGHLLTLARIGRVALILLLLSGTLLDLLSGGAWHERAWFRGSFLLVVILAFLNQLAQRALRADALRRARNLAWGMCGLVGIITLLMEAKPQ